MGKFETFDSAFKVICQDVAYEYEFVCSPRGQKIRERLGYTFCLEDPRHRLIMNPIRDAKYGFGVGEFLWYWQGRQDLATMQYYNKRSAGFSDDGTTLNSAYGHRLLRLEYGFEGGDPDNCSQWTTCRETLLKDNDSRRAIMLINNPLDEFKANSQQGSKDVPCTLALQFFIRWNKLYLHTTMRSNDVFWGLTYDLFSFTLLQECMMLELKRDIPELELGSYYHTAGSMHIYERHFDHAGKIAQESKRSWQADGKMAPLTSTVMLQELCLDEGLLRTGKIQNIDLGKYRGGELWMAGQLNLHREKRDLEQRK